MDDMNSIVVETATRLFHENISHELLARAEAGEWPASLWRAVEEAGLPQAMIPEEAGGFGLDGVAAANLVRLAAFHAAPLPLAETMLASRLLAEAGLDIPPGPLSVAVAGQDDGLRLERDGAHWRVKGVAPRTPWGRLVENIVIAGRWRDENFVALAQTAAGVVSKGINLANEPRDDLSFDLALDAASVAPGVVGPAELRLYGAALRSIAIAGAIDRALEMTLAHVEERVQFGRPLGKFQAVQQALAVLAGHAAAAGGAADIAAECLAGGLDATLVAAAKIRTGEAAGAAAAIAHQLHGAMGFSHEHMLHFLTKRLWSWRDEFGSETEWSRRLGADVLQRGSNDLWPFVVAA